MGGLSLQQFTLLFTIRTGFAISFPEISIFDGMVRATNGDLPQRGIMACRELQHYGRNIKAVLGQWPLKMV